MKKNTISLTALSKQGEIYFYNPEILNDFLKGIEGDLEVTIKKWYRRRTDRENRYYWAVVIPIVADEIGDEDRDAVHVAIQLAVGHSKILAGEKVPIGTSHLSTSEFEEYAEKVRMWASKQGWYIPLPNEGISGLN